MIDDTSHGRVEIGVAHPPDGVIPAARTDHANGQSAAPETTAGEPGGMPADGMVVTAGETALREIAELLEDPRDPTYIPPRDPAGIVMAVREKLREAERVHARNLVLERDRRLVHDIVNGRGPR